jgi:exopolysaccharide production protein ExoZ
MARISSTKFNCIQALRAFAACLVVLTHSTFYAHERLDKAFGVWQAGTRGVDIFFVISGFVMVYSSQKMLARVDGWRVFATHRITRIVPLYWFVTTLKVAVLVFTTGFALHSILSPATVACSYLFLPAKDLDGKLEPLVGVGWTLNFEMLFYVFFALALFLQKNIYWFVGLALAILSVGGSFRQPSWPPAAFYLNSVVLEFHFGMLIARGCLRGAYLSRKIALPMLVAGFCLLLLPPANWAVPKVILSGCPAAMIIWAAVSLEQWARAIPKWVLYLGDASYAIYLIHPFVCPLTPAVFHRLRLDLPGSAVCISVAIGVLAGCILHQAVERPLTAWLKKAMAPRREPAQATA